MLNVPLSVHLGLPAALLAVIRNGDRRAKGAPTSTDQCYLGALHRRSPPFAGCRLGFPVCGGAAIEWGFGAAKMGGHGVRAGARIFAGLQGLLSAASGTARCGGRARSGSRALRLFPPGRRCCGRWAGQPRAGRRGLQGEGGGGGSVFEEVASSWGAFLGVFPGGRRAGPAAALLMLPAANGTVRDCPGGCSCWGGASSLQRGVLLFGATCCRHTATEKKKANSLRDCSSFGESFPRLIKGPGRAGCGSRFFYLH